MEEKLHLDPRTKQAIKELLYNFLYQPVMDRMKLRLEQIIVKNSLILNNSSNRFLYKGEVYTTENAKYHPQRTPRLSPQLHNEMKSYLETLTNLNQREVPYVIGFINKVLNSSNDLHDYLRVLPESIHRPIEKLILSCPCRTKQLSDTQVEQIKEEGKYSIDLIKQRMAANLLI